MRSLIIIIYNLCVSEQDRAGGAISQGKKPTGENPKPQYPIDNSGKDHFHTIKGMELDGLLSSTTSPTTLSILSQKVSMPRENSSLNNYFLFKYMF